LSNFIIPNAIWQHRDEFRTKAPIHSTLVDEIRSASESLPEFLDYCVEQAGWDEPVMISIVMPRQARNVEGPVVLACIAYV
jgi:hypothetical protein